MTAPLPLSDERPAHTPTWTWLRWTITAIAAAMSLYHMYVAGFGPPEAVIFRGIHLLFALTLVFLLFPTRPNAGAAWRVIDLLLLVAAWACVLHIFLNYDYFINRIIYIDDLTLWDKIYGVIAVIVVLEATRRVIGLSLPLTAMAFLIYAGLFTHVTGEVLIEQLYLSTEGIFGSTLGVSASYVMLFVLFGAFMERSGTGQLFMDFALSLTGHSAGGPGKVAVISSSLFGTVSGSAVANVMVDGPMTIPLMKRTGFKPEVAAAIEAVASTGGQLMPPVMGAAAFVMAEFLAVSYFQVTVWAAIPAFLYYVAVFFAVHFVAKRDGLHGVPRAELPRLGRVMAQRGHLFIPILIVFFGLLLGYSAPLCALIAAIACLPVALLRASTRADINWGSVIGALEDGARNTLSVAMACACAGIVIACVTITGLGITFTQVVIALSKDYLLLALMLTALAGIVLGMGMPTTPAYIVMVALLVPALIKLGAAVPAAHMFAFYFAILSAITPPVALAVFAAAGLAKANMWNAGFAAMRVAAPAYIVPFMFVYEPALLMIGDPVVILGAVVTATIGAILLAGSLFGYLIGPCKRWHQVLLFIAAMCLIKPGWETDIVGLILLAPVAVAQYLAKPKGTRNATAEVLVIGSGVMGRGIAKSFAAAGISSAIVSRNAAGVRGIDTRVAVLDKLPQEAPALIIESVPEEMQTKFACYAAIESAYAGAPVLASNTSGIDLEALARPLKHPQRFIGMHYFMPADVNTMVEVAPVRASDPAAVDAAVKLLRAAGRNFVRLKRAVPGLLINRLQHAILHEAYYLIDEGVASAEEIDRCARDMLAPRMCITGLIEQKDISGLDTHALAQRALVPVLHHGDKPRRALQDLYEAGHLGIKTGRGFYDWSGKDPEKVKAEAGRKLTELLAFLKQLR